VVNGNELVNGGVARRATPPIHFKKMTDATNYARIFPTSLCKNSYEMIAIRHFSSRRLGCEDVKQLPSFRRESSAAQMSEDSSRRTQVGRLFKRAHDQPVVVI